MAGVLARQSKEPLCSECVSYAITLEEAKEASTNIKTLSSEGDVPEEFQMVLDESVATISALNIPDNPVKQRKLGRCRLPDKACFVKKSRMIFLFFKEKKSSK